MRYRIRHVTEYRYDEFVALNHNVARVVPRSDQRQRVLAHQVTVDPSPAGVRRFVDLYGNTVVAFDLEAKHRAMTLTAEGEVEIDARGPVELGTSMPWDAVADPHIARPFEVADFAYDSTMVQRSAALAALARPHAPPGRPVLEVARELTTAIHETFTYDPDATQVSTPLPDVLTLRRGVCQDFSHVMLGALRSLGIAASYVSGYLETTPPPGRPRLVGADATHAWVRVYGGPRHGFVDFDPTNDCIPDDRHVVTAIGRDFADVSPVKGLLLGGGRTHVHVSVDVLRLEHT